MALVLAGGGARGAYEIGALSALLPAIEEAQRPRIVVGTSVGAINAAYVAANAQKPTDELVAAGLSLWRGISYEQVLEPLASLPELARLGGYVGSVLGIPGLQAASVLDPAPLTDTLNRLITFEAIHRNVESQALDAAAVVATSGATNTSVVFHDGGAEPPTDRGRGIEYVRTELSEAHVRASAAIPLLFPAVPIGAGEDRRWYFDGGSRLNTPIKPALELGAGRVIVIALNSLTPRSQAKRERRPDVLDGATQLIQAVLVDPLVNDVRTLATINGMLADSSAAKVAANERRTKRRRVPYMLIAPEDPEAVGRLAAETYLRHYGSPLALVRSPNVAALGRLVDGGSDASHGELLSYLFFAREFTDGLIELGRHDGERWLNTAHDDGNWQLGPLP